MTLINNLLDRLGYLRKDGVSAIEITTKIGCIISCVYCPQEKFIRKYSEKSKDLELSFQVFKACLDKIPARVDVLFAGMCEPFLNPECAKMILYAHEKQHAVCVDTTLAGMNISDIELFKNVPFQYFCVHLPSGDSLEKINMDDKYMSVLERIGESGINIHYHFHGKNVHPKVGPLIKGRIFSSYTSTRAGNVAWGGKPKLIRKRGVIRCARNLRWNVLLPNGDVILCSSDYGMQHKLGNLLTGDYASLFKSKEFKKIQRGLNKDSEDILCRYCDVYTHEYEGLVSRVIKKLRGKWKFCIYALTIMVAQVELHLGCI